MTNPAQVTTAATNNPDPQATAALRATALQHLIAINDALASFHTIRTIARDTTRKPRARLSHIIELLDEHDAKHPSEATPA